jgi:sulfur carrier protein ThiS
MPEATFWFSSPFREWLGQRTATVRWRERITLREVLERLGTEHAAFRRNVIDGGLTQDAFNHLAAVIVEGDFLALDSTIPDGAEVHVFTPLSGGTAAGSFASACRLLEIVGGDSWPGDSRTGGLSERTYRRPDRAGQSSEGSRPGREPNRPEN